MATPPDAPDAPNASRAALTALVFAPTGRDGPLLCDALAAASIDARPVASAGELVAAVAAEVTGGDAPRLGAVVVADDALGVDWSRQLAEVLDRQPSWSDLPVVLLASSGGVAGERRWSGPRAPAAVAERLTGHISVTVLDRPARVATLVSAVRAALRARGRQAEVRELIAARDRALAEAERASRAKSEFLAMMGHELRTPLNAIAGYVDLLLLGVRGTLTEPQREDLERIRRSQRHLLGVINDILNFARLESGRLEFDLSTFALTDVVAEVTPMIEPQLTDKGLALDVSMPAADVRVVADREKLRQVLLNLLSNAVKFTPSGGRISVIGDAPADSNDVLVRVCDTGVGIPAEKLEAIFEPFVQVRSDLSAAREGTGLGLAISRDLMRGMGGDLRAASELGRGSTFTVRLRRAAATPQDATNGPADRDSSRYAVPRREAAAPR
jgi:signal transduction histidine kinase